MQKIIQYIKDSIVELKKVIWPTKDKTTNDTLAVIIISLITASFIGLADFFLTQIINLFIRQ